jgi:ubiquinone biosynthesis protein COQ9
MPRLIETGVTEPLDMNLDELRDALAPLVPAHAAFDGWGEGALAAAAGTLGIPAGRARLAFAQGGAQMIDAWFDWIDKAMLAAFPPEKIAAMKIRDRIRSLLLFRFQTLAPHREALRRALALLALPQNAVAGASLAWRSADRIWRLAGDRATDFNHYSKRAILIGVYGSTSLVFLDDDSADMAETRAFLDRRIEDVMRFEKAKARWKGRAPPFSLTRFLGRLRYPAA